jgi:hypothetical protein
MNNLRTVSPNEKFLSESRKLRIGEDFFYRHEKDDGLEVNDDQTVIT